MPQSQEKKENRIEPLVSGEVVKSRLIDVDSAKEILVPREIKSWMEKVEEAATATPQVNDNTGQPLLTSSPPPSPKVTLPITRNSFLAGFQKTISDAGHWLSRFILRLIKLNKGQVIFKPPQNES